MNIFNKIKSLFIHPQETNNIREFVYIIGDKLRTQSDKFSFYRDSEGFKYHHLIYNNDGKSFDLKAVSLPYFYYCGNNITITLNTEECNYIYNIIKDTVFKYQCKTESDDNFKAVNFLKSI